MSGNWEVGQGVEGTSAVETESGSCMLLHQHLRTGFSYKSGQTTTGHKNSSQFDLNSYTSFGE